MRYASSDVGGRKFTDAYYAHKPIEPDSLKSVVTLRPVWGNLATKHNRSPAQLKKPYAANSAVFTIKKIGNSGVRDTKNWRATCRLGSVDFMNTKN